MGELIKGIIKIVAAVAGVSAGVTLGKKGTENLGNYRKTAGGNSNAGSNQQ